MSDASVEVTAQMDGPDVTGFITVENLATSGVRVAIDGAEVEVTVPPGAEVAISFDVFEGDAAAMFGQLGRAIEFINANADPS